MRTKTSKRTWQCSLAGVCSFAALATASPRVSADEAGVSFWLPGQFSSFAATPSPTGFSLPVIYYRYSGSTGTGTQFQRGGRITSGSHADSDLAILTPTYAPPGSVLGGQLTLGITAVFGHTQADVDATLTGPGGTALSNFERDSLTGFGDLYPTAQLRWTTGYFNALWYVMGGVPVGAYDATRLANLGANHWAADTGLGFTYFNTEGGHEASAVVGTTYNFENPATAYQNGVNIHGDAALSQFLSKEIHVGLVGYLYNQLSSDSGSSQSGFKSSVYAAGLQVGTFFNAGSYKPYLNLKGYYEFGAKNRVEGYNLWFTLAIPFSPEEETSSPTSSPPAEAAR